MSKRFRIVLIILALAIVLYSAAVGAMNTAWFHRVLVRGVIANLENLTGAHVEIGDLIFRPIILELTLHGLVLRGKESGREPPLLSARTVVMRLNPISWLRQRLLLRSLDCEDAEAYLRTYPDGTTNLPGPRPARRGASVLDNLVDLAIGRLTVSRTDLVWDDQQLPLEFSARDVAILLRSSLGRGYAGSVSSSQLRFKTRRWSLPSITFSSRLDFSRDAFKLTSLTWRCRSVSGQGAFSLRKLPALEARLDLQAQGEVSQVLRIPELRAGNFNWNSQVTYRRGELEAKGAVRASQVMIQSSSFKSGSLSLSADYLADRHRVQLPNLTVSFLGGTAQGRAEISLLDSAPKFMVRTQLRGIDLAELLDSVSPGQEVFRSLRADANVEGTADASWHGWLKDFTSEFNLSFESRTGARIGSRPVVGFARGSAVMAPSLWLNLQDVQLQTPHSSLAAQGTLGAKPSNLEVRLATTDFEEWRPLVEEWSAASELIPLVLKSSASFTGAVTGSISEPEIHGRLKLGSFDYRDWRWEDLEADVVATPQRLQVSNGRLRHATSTLAFDLSLGLEHGNFMPGAPVHIIAQAQRTPLEDLRDALNLGYPFSGMVTGRLELQGTRTNLAGRGALSVEPVTIAQEPFDSLSASIGVTSSAWNFQAIQLVKGRGRITGQVSLDPSRRTYSAQLHGADLSVAEFKHFARPQQPAASLADAMAEKLEGHLNFDLHGEGRLDNPQLQSNFEVRNITSNGGPGGNLRGRLSWNAAQMRLEAEFQGLGGALNFTATARTEGDWPVQLSGRYKDFRADPWINLAQGGRFKAVVTATGSLSASGPLKDWERLELQTRADSMGISFPSGARGSRAAHALVWENEQPVELRYANRVLTAAPFGLRGPSTQLQIEGSIHFADSAQLSVTAQGHADAALLRLFDPALQSTGRFDLKLEANGRPSQPLLRGAVTVRDLSVGYADLPYRLAGLNGEIQLEGDRATVTSLRGVSGRGSVNLEGFVTLGETPRFDVRAELDRAPLEYPTDFTSILTGSLRFTGTPESGQVNGDLIVRQMFVNPDFNLLAWMGQFGGPARLQPSGIASPLASKVQLDVGVASGPEVRLESPDLSLVATINLRLKGTAANPVGFGNVHIESGEALIRGDRYKLTRGDINMTSPFRTRPVIDLEAQTRVQRYNLTLNVSGPLDRARITYRSDPPLPTADILSLLALGYTHQAEELTAGRSQPFGGLGASTLLSQALSTQVSGRVQRLFGISRIRIDPNVGAPTTTGGTRVTVEEQVAPDLTITYITNTGTSQERVIRLEWDISDKASLMGERDQNGVFGLELRFRRRLK